MANSEAKFSSEIRTDLKSVFKDDIHVNLLPDMRRTLKKPYDSYFCYKGIFCAMEFKRVDGHTFNFKNDVKPHQPECLKSVITACGNAMFLICFNRHKKSFIVGPNLLEEMASKDSAIKFQIFEQLPVENHIVRKKFNGETRWEVERIIEYVL